MTSFALKVLIRKPESHEGFIVTKNQASIPGRYISRILDTCCSDPQHLLALSLAPNMFSDFSRRPLQGIALSSTDANQSVERLNA